MSGDRNLRLWWYSISFALDALNRDAMNMAKPIVPTTAPPTGFVTARTVGHDQVVISAQQADTDTDAGTALTDTAAVEKSPTAATPTDESVGIAALSRNSRNSLKTVLFASVAFAAQMVAE